MSRLTAWRFTIPLKRTLVLKGQPYSTREGILIEREGYWAEASPLPGFSSDSVDDVITALREDNNGSAALNFAMQALADFPTAPLSVPINQLLIDEFESARESTGLSVANGCRSVKLKVGRGELQSEIDLVKRVRGFLPDSVKLRLDANQAWSLEEAIEFANATSDIELEYIEEPLRNPDLLEDLYSRTGVKYALDETLSNAASIEAWPNVAALVCKPTIIGGLSSIKRLAESNKPLVFSSAFESGIGIARIVQLAAKFSPQIPAGLDTLGFLTNDLLVDSPAIKDGQICFYQEPKANRMLLKRVEL